MRICLISTEMAGIGAYGGFGQLTRDISTALAARGLEVYVAMPQKNGQKPVQVLDGVTVLSYPSSLYRRLKPALPFLGLYRAIDADIYHSEEPSIGTLLAQMAEPQKKHIITFQDPRSPDERNESLSERDSKSAMARLRSRVRAAFEFSNLRKAVKRADALFCQAWYATPKAQRLYNFKGPAEFLPNPVEIPRRQMHKADTPTVCFLGRWDPRKRPEYFFELARRFPDVRFVAMGGCHAGPTERECMLRNKYSDIPNLEMVGWALGERKSSILEEAWVLVNTSWRECLPVSYLEGCAHKCAILSHCNADDFPKEFGYWARRGDAGDFEEGLQFLLERDRWKTLDGYN